METILADKLYIPDTNALINFPEFMLRNQTLLVEPVVRELTTLERKKDYKTLQYQLRHAKRTIKKGMDKGLVNLSQAMTDKELHDLYVMDDRILDEVEAHIDSTYREIVLLTDDVLMSAKAKGRGIPTQSVYELRLGSEHRQGVYEFHYSPESEEHREILAKIEVHAGGYVEEGYNPFDMKTNQYLVIWDKSTEAEDKDGKLVYKEIGTFKFDGTRLVRPKFKNINSTFESVKPINVRQRLAFDLLQDQSVAVKLLTGVHGSGKDHLMVSHAVDMIKRGEYDQIVWVRNNIEVKDTNGIGYLPDSMENKLRPFIEPLIDKLGGEEGYYQFEDKINIQHLGFLRGREFKNSIIYVTEGQTITREHAKLLLGRVGEGSQLWVNGDMKQTDDRKFEHDNGINALMDLAGNELFGHVELDKVERSETANLASKL